MADVVVGRSVSPAEREDTIAVNLPTMDHHFAFFNFCSIYFQSKHIILDLFSKEGKATYIFTE